MPFFSLRRLDGLGLAVWLQVAQVAGGGLGFAFWILVARFLGPGKTGEVEFALAIGSYAFLVAAPGLNQLGIARASGPVSEIVGDAFSLSRVRILQLVAVTTLVAVISLQLQPGNPSLALLIVASVIRRSAPEWLQIARSRGSVVVTTRVSYYVLALAGTWWLVGQTPSKMVLGWVMLAASVITTSAAWGESLYDLEQKSPLDRLLLDGRNQLREWRRTIADGLPIAMGDASGQLIANADMIMLGFWVSSTDLGLYAMAYRVLLVGQGLGVAIRHAALQRLGAARGQSPVGQLKALVKPLAVLLLSTSAIVTWVAEPAMVLAFGEDYRASSQALSFLIWSLPLDIIGALHLNLLIVTERRRRYGQALGAAAASNVLLNALTIGIFGVPGAIFSTLMSLALLLVLSSWTAFRADSVPSHTVAIILATAGGVAGTAAWFWIAPPVGAFIHLVTVVAYWVLPYRRRKR